MKRFNIYSLTSIDQDGWFSVYKFSTTFAAKALTTRLSMDAVTLLAALDFSFLDSEVAGMTVGTDDTVVLASIKTCGS